MDLKQKYIGGMSHYEIDDWFVRKLKELPKDAGIDIAYQADYNFDLLPTQEGWTQKVGGVCTRTKEPLYFELEYLHQPDERPIFLDVEVIDVDDYLDYILENKILISNINEQDNYKQ